MNRNLLISFVCLVIMFLMMRYQGRVLITPLSSKGIIDLEFAATAERFRQLRLFWNLEDVRLNIYLDFLFIASYAWFFVSACKWIEKKMLRPSWNQAFITMSVAAALFDVCENFLMLLVLNGRFEAWVLHIVFYCALIKFILAGIVLLYIAGSIVYLITKRKVV